MAHRKQRSTDRIRPNRPLLVHYPHYLGRVQDFGLRGVFVQSERPRLLGERLQLTFWGDIEESFQAEGIVRHVRPLLGMGVEFLSLNGAGIRTLCHYWSIPGSQGPRERRVPVPRIPAPPTVLAEVQGTMSRVRDINPFGAFVEHPRSVPLGSAILLNVWLDGAQAIPVRGRVRRVEPGQGIGVEFLNVSNGDFNRMWESLVAAQ